MRLAVVCAASVFIGGCSLFDSKGSTLEITARIAPSAFRAGDHAVVTLTTTNVGRTPQRILSNPCSSLFLVLNSQDKIAGVPGSACAPIGDQKALKPGENFVQTFQWSGYVSGAADEAVDLAPGVYKIRSMFSDDEVMNHAAIFEILK